MHRLEVRQHPAEPALVDERHADPARLVGDGLLRLLLGADVQDRAAVRHGLPDELVGLVDQLELDGLFHDGPPTFVDVNLSRLFDGDGDRNRARDSVRSAPKSASLSKPGTSAAPDRDPSSTVLQMFDVYLEITEGTQRGPCNHLAPLW